MVQIQSADRLLALFADDERGDDDEKERKNRREDACARNGRAVLSASAFTEYPAEDHQNDARSDERERRHHAPQWKPQQARLPESGSEEERDDVNTHNADLCFGDVELAELQRARYVGLPVCDVEEDDGGYTIEKHPRRMPTEARGATGGDTDEDGRDAVTSKNKF